MSKGHLYRVGRADFNTLAAIGTQLAEGDERTASSRPDRVLWAGEQAYAAAAAFGGYDDAHDSAHV
jgi:hypothetical protein